MTEAEAKEIVRRYEELVAAIGNALIGPDCLGAHDRLTLANGGLRLVEIGVSWDAAGDAEIDADLRDVPDSLLETIKLS